MCTVAYVAAVLSVATVHPQEFESLLGTPVKERPVAPAATVEAEASTGDGLFSEDEGGSSSSAPSNAAAQDRGLESAEARAKYPSLEKHVRAASPLLAGGGVRVCVCVWEELHRFVGESLNKVNPSNF